MNQDINLRVLFLLSYSIEKSTLKVRSHLLKSIMLKIVRKNIIQMKSKNRNKNRIFL